MPFNGAGIFARIYSWVTDEANGVFVDATRTDTDSDDIAQGLTNCVTRDGQSPPTADLPMATFKLTGLGAGSANTDSVNYGQVFNSPAFVTPTATTNPATSDSTLRLATTFMVQQVAMQAALPAIGLGLVASNDGTTSAFTKSISFALNFAKGAAVASVSAPDIWAGNGNFEHITGTTPITGLAAAPQAGATRWLYFDDATPLTSGASFVVAGGSQTMSAGDIALVVADTTTQFYVRIFKGSGNQAPYPYLHVRNEQPNTTAPATSAATTQNVVVLNTTVGTNSITGASLASNIVTLPAGTYEFLASSPYFSGAATSTNKLALYNDSDAADILVGPSANSGIGGGGAQPTGAALHLGGRFTLTATKNVKLRHYTSTAISLGTAASTGQIEVYGSLQLWKIA